MQKENSWARNAKANWNLMSNEQTYEIRMTPEVQQIFDNLYDQAVKVCNELGNTSTSSIQKMHRQLFEEVILKLGIKCSKQENIISYFM